MDHSAPKRTSSPEPSVVYHYTSIEALLAIVESGSIRATNLHYLNDVGEYRYCLELMRNHLSSFLASHPSKYDDAFKEALGNANPASMSDFPYAASFSTLNDSLPQWRSYCPSGNGVSLGFRVDSLRQSSLSNMQKHLVPAPQPTLQEVKYVAEQSTAAIDSLMGDCLQDMKEWNTELQKWRADQKELAPKHQIPIPESTDPRWFQTFIEQRASTVKHEAFASEAEYRLLARGINYFPETIRYRSSRTTLIPFVDLKMPAWGDNFRSAFPLDMAYADYYLSEITVGPSANPGLTVDSLQGFFQAKRVAIEIKESHVPFRDL